VKGGDGDTSFDGWHFGVRNGETRVGNGRGVWRRCSWAPFIVLGR
jgi:hypothetical protein